jgi:hypothetical protein
MGHAQHVLIVDNNAEMCSAVAGYLHAKHNTNSYIQN